IVRRRRHEQRYAARTETSAVVYGQAPDDIGAAIHEELGRLPERFRGVAVLCLLEGKSYAEAARSLGCPAGAVMSRLAEAPRRPRGRLGGGGRVPSPAGPPRSAAAVDGEARAVSHARVPAALVAAATRRAASRAFLLSTGSGMTEPAALLMRKVLRTMFIAKL